jgi:hypothetical protein
VVAGARARAIAASAASVARLPGALTTAFAVRSLLPTVAHPAASSGNVVAATAVSAGRPRAAACAGRERGYPTHVPTRRLTAWRAADVDPSIAQCSHCLTDMAMLAMRWAGPEPCCSQMTSGVRGSSLVIFGDSSFALSAISASRRSSSNSPGTSNRLRSTCVVNRSERSTSGAVSFASV